MHSSSMERFASLQSMVILKLILAQLLLGNLILIQ